MNIESFMNRVYPEPNTGCWIWSGCVDRGGYGQIKIRGKQYKSHRVSLVLHGIPVPQGMAVDHKCKVTSCCNPLHLEVCSPGENTRRFHAERTHCKSGHPLHGNNLYVGKDGCRQCVECRRTRSREWYRANKIKR